MARRYRKIDPRFWTDERIAPLAADEKLIAIYCFTGQANRIGLYCFSPGQATEETGLRAETFGKGFKRVRETLRLGWDEATRTLYLPTWWKYNCPENPNVLKACLADLHDLPRSPLLSQFSENVSHLPETFHQTFRTTVKTFANGLGERMADQEQEQEQEQEKRGMPATRAILGDADFLQALRDNPAYRRLNLDHELAKMDIWLQTPRGRGKRKTRGRIVAWLNRALEDLPLDEGKGGEEPYGFER